MEGTTGQTGTARMCPVWVTFNFYRRIAFRQLEKRVHHVQTLRNSRRIISRSKWIDDEKSSLEMCFSTWRVSFQVEEQGRVLKAWTPKYPEWCYVHGNLVPVNRRLNLTWSLLTFALCWTLLLEHKIAVGDFTDNSRKRKSNKARAWTRVALI